MTALTFSIHSSMIDLTTYSEQITYYIKQLLLDGHLHPGDKVNEVHIASALSISRAPVREALQLLATEGLIESLPQRGKFIKALTPQEILDSYFVGGVLEGAAVAATAHLLTKKDFVVLQNTIDKMKDLSSSHNVALIAELDQTFHKRLLCKSGNSILQEQARTVCQRISKFLLAQHWHKQYSPDERAWRHQEVLDVVKTKDAYLIENTIREHYISLSKKMATFGSKKNVR